MSNEAGMSTQSAFALEAILPASQVGGGGQEGPEGHEGHEGGHEGHEGHEGEKGGHIVLDASPIELDDVPAEALARCTSPEQKERMKEYFKRRASIYSLTQVAMPKHQTIKELKCKLMLYTIPAYIASALLILAGIAICVYGEIRYVNSKDSERLKKERASSKTSAQFSVDVNNMIKLGGSVGKNSNCSNF